MTLWVPPEWESCANLSANRVYGSQCNFCIGTRHNGCTSSRHHLPFYIPYLEGIIWSPCFIVQRIIRKYSRFPTLHCRCVLCWFGRPRNLTIVKFVGRPPTPLLGRWWQARHSGQMILNERFSLIFSFSHGNAVSHFVIGSAVKVESPQDSVSHRINFDLDRCNNVRLRFYN